MQVEITGMDPIVTDAASYVVVVVVCLVALVSETGLS